MSTPSSAPSSEKPPGDDGEHEGLLDVLKMLMETGKAKTVTDLIRYAEQSRAPRSAERLRMMAAEGIPIDLAFDAISVDLRILAHKKNSSMLQQCKGKRVGLIVPVPPYVIDIFASVAKVDILSPSEHPLPGHLHERKEHVVQGARACKQTAEQAEVLVFEAFRLGEQLYVEPSVADVADTRTLQPSTRLMIHLRPHQNPEDIAYSPNRAASYV